MCHDSRKVIILNKLSSPYISEAIIILKNGAAVPQTKIIEDAERIVQSYMNRTEKSGYPQKKDIRRYSQKTLIMLCIAAALVSFLVCFIIRR